MAAVVHSGKRRQGVVRGLDDLAAGVVDVVDPRERRLVDEQEAEHLDGLGELVDALGDQRHRGVEQRLLVGGRRVGDEPGGGEVGHRAGGRSRRPTAAACGRR